MAIGGSLVPRFGGPKMAMRRIVVWWRHLGVNSADVFLAAYPKSGSTWLAFILARLLTGRESTFDNVGEVVPGVEYLRGMTGVLGSGGRLVRTHEPYRTAYRKAVYLVRDARDVAVSYFHYMVGRGRYRGDLSAFVHLFLNGTGDGYGSWGAHIWSWLKSRAHAEGNVLVVRYEDMLVDPLGTVAGICDFLGVRKSEQEIGIAVASNAAEKMKQKERSSTHLARHLSGKPFVRRAESGNWATLLSPDDNAEVISVLGAQLSTLGYPTDSPTG